MDNAQDFRCHWNRWHELLNKIPSMRGLRLPTSSEGPVSSALANAYRNRHADTYAEVARLRSERDIVRVQRENCDSWWQAILLEMKLRRRSRAADAAQAALDHHRGAYLQAVKGDIETYRGLVQQERECEHQLKLDRAQKIDDALRAVPAGAVLDVPVAGSPPSADPRDPSDSYYLDEMERFVDELPRLVSQLAAVTECDRLLKEIGSPVLPSILGSSYATNAGRSLSQLLPPTQSARDISEGLSFDKLMHHAARPEHVVAPAAWLVFWTATAASLGYARKAVGSVAPEPQKVSFWTESWRNSVKGWTPATLRALGIDRSTVATAIADVGHTAAETQTGTDVHLFVVSRTRERAMSCRVVSIQFKRAEGDGDALSVYRDGPRQLDGLRKLVDRTQGRYQAMYGLLRNVESGLSVTSAVSLASAVQALQDPRTSVHAVAPSPTYTFHWHARGEPLATAIAGALTLSIRAYSSPLDALEDVKKQTGALLKGQLLVQAFGYDANTLARELARCSRLYREQNLGFDVGQDLLAAFEREVHKLERGQGMER